MNISELEQLDSLRLKMMARQLGISQWSLKTKEVLVTEILAKSGGEEVGKSEPEGNGLGEVVPDTMPSPEIPFEPIVEVQTQEHTQEGQETALPKPSIYSIIHDCIIAGKTTIDELQTAVCNIYPDKADKSYRQTLMVYRNKQMRRIQKVTV